MAVDCGCTTDGFNTLLKNVVETLDQLKQLHVQEVKTLRSQLGETWSENDLVIPEASAIGGRRAGDASIQWSTSNQASDSSNDVTSPIAGLADADVGIIDGQMSETEDTGAVLTERSSLTLHGVEVLTKSRPSSGSLQADGICVVVQESVSNAVGFRPINSLESVVSPYEGSSLAGSSLRERCSRFSLPLSSDTDKILHQHHVRKPWADYKGFDKVRLDVIFDRLLEGLNASSTYINRIASLRSQSESTSCLLHPYAKWRVCWVLGCVFLLAYDIVMVPVDITFDLEPFPEQVAWDIFCAVFWSLDMLLTFRTCVETPDGYETRPLQIASIYLKSWFLFDVLLILQDWLSILASNADFSSMSMARGVRWGRFIRFMRLARVVRIAKVKNLLRQMVFHYHLSAKQMELSKRWLVSALGILISLHISACLWYAVCDFFEEEWVRVDVASASVVRKYIISLSWACSRFHGLAYKSTPRNSWAILTDTILIIFNTFVVALYVGHVASMAVTWANSRKVYLSKVSTAFVVRYKISVPMQYKVQKILAASLYNGAREIETDERALLDSLPSTVQGDLLYEARVPHVCSRTVFRDMESVNPRVVRHVCNQAMCPTIFLEHERVFDSGDACTRMVFVTSGTCVYSRGSGIGESSTHCSNGTRSRSRCSNGSRSRCSHGSRRSRYSNGEQLIQKGRSLSEQVLWTMWVHNGLFAAVEESTALCLDSLHFGEVVEQHTDCLIHLVKYSRHFVWLLNCMENADDLTDFGDQLNWQAVDEDIIQGQEQSHFMFISHFKVESGTEASLMRDFLDENLKSDQNHPANHLRSPVFIDSEDLVDLATLKEHVCNSVALVLLLTPSLFTRPWCLLEIVTAIRTGVRIVPVEIQRPGMRYQYPDEQFYSRIRSGVGLTRNGQYLLQHEGISLEEVEQAIRHVFEKIAVSFSPHKSKSFRDVELKSILRRCNECLIDTSK